VFELSSISIDTLLSTASLAFGVGGLAAALWPATTRTRWWYVGAVCLVCFVATASALAWQNHRRQQRVDVCVQTIIGAFEGKAKTVDQLYDRLFPEDFGTFSEALALLLASKRVDHRLEPVTDHAGLSYTTRLYFLK
jgi:hypothetical protein